jgi:hypothetical protein
MGEEGATTIGQDVSCLVALLPLRNPIRIGKRQQQADGVRPGRLTCPKPVYMSQLCSPLAGGTCNPIDRSSIDRAAVDMLLDVSEYINP